MGTAQFKEEQLDAISKLIEITSKIFDSTLSPITTTKAEALKVKFPALPESYLNLLTKLGAGTTTDMGFIIYESPIEAEDIFDPITASELRNYLFLGDDFSGWMIAYDTMETPWKLCEFNHQDLIPNNNPYPDLASYLIHELTKAEE